MDEGPAEHLGTWERLKTSFRRRRGARWALRVLFCLYGTAIFAPLIATDRPLLLKAVDVRAYEGARKSLPFVVKALTERMAAGEGQAAAAELEAARLRVATMKQYLPSERTGELERLEVELARALGEASALESLAAWPVAELCDQLAPRSAETPAAPPEAGIELSAKLSFPGLESIAGLEAALMALWVLFGGLALSKRAIRRRPLVRLIGVASAAALFGLGWSLAFEREPSLQTGAIKAGLTRGEIAPERVVLAALGLGFDESHMNERFRPPTWRADSELDERGRYVRGGQARTPGAQPVEIRYGEAPLNSAWRHPLGTDSLGRDLVARLLWGGRISLAVGLLSAALVLLLGVCFGGLAGFLGGKVDFVVSRLIEVFQSFPAFFLILTVVALIPEQSVHPMVSIIGVIGIVGWTGVARLVRAEILRVRELDYVLAARSLGLSNARVLLRHVLPNAMGPVWVAGAFAVASGILIESAVSFLGFGVRLPFPSWGALINDSRVPEHWWIQVFPGALIFVTVVCYNLVGEGLRDALDPREAA
jgi:peptide/nickel transport system permease protein